MRGRTLNDAFIILDEGQNTTVAQMKMFLTRMGHGSKIVVTGDVTQIDLPRTTPSGLTDAVHRLRNVERIGVITWTNATSSGTRWCSRSSRRTRATGPDGHAVADTTHLPDGTPPCVAPFPGPIIGQRLDVAPGITPEGTVIVKPLLFALTCLAAGSPSTAGARRR